MDETAADAPRRSPPIAEDLGVVGAVSVGRHRLAWCVAGAFAILLSVWIGTSVAIVWCAAVAIVLFRIPLLPRRALTAGGVALTCCLVGAAVGVLSEDHDMLRVYWGILGTGHALILVWAAAVARALRRHVSPDDAERASARVVIWVQDHPWRAILGLFLPFSPFGALHVQAAHVVQLRGSAPLLSDVGAEAGSSAGFLLLVAAVLQGRLLRVAERLLPVVTLTFGTWLALVWVMTRGAIPIADVMTRVVAEIVKMGLVLVAVEWGFRIAMRRPPGKALVTAVLVLATVARAAGCALACRDDTTPSNDPYTPLLLHAVHDAPFLALVVLLAASTLPARSAILVAVLFGVAEAALISVTAEDRANVPWAAYAAIRVVSCVNQALFALAARRVRSMTVVPADHVLRADWAVDLRPPAPIAAPPTP